MLSVKNLYTDKTNSFILIIMNKLTKHAIYIAINKDLNIKSLADIL